ncbi:MAG: hypothetical protein CM15mP58_21960 [Burkholderiaceae bacterium]|nr:MAG: hypothetical protein CM15mP58_21960 [Burkholderiaceae bacterium]
MRWIGECEKAFEMMCERAASRELAPGKPLAMKQTIQNWIAESRAEINASRLMVLDAAKKIDKKVLMLQKLKFQRLNFMLHKFFKMFLIGSVQVHGALE